MIQPQPGQPGWYRLDRETARPLFGTPGLGLEPCGRAIEAGVHYVAPRNLLTLLEDPAALKLLTPPPVSAATWAARDALTEPLGFKLRTTQQQALDFIEPRRGVLIGDDMRLGKTLTAIMAHDPARGKLVIVAPLSARGVWLGWIRRRFPDADIGVLTSRKFDPAPLAKPFVFVHYDVIQHWQNTFLIGTLVFDEAHLLGNHKTKRTTAASLLAQHARKVIALTGTPIWNQPPNLWSLLSLLGPRTWGSYYDFCDRYGAPVQTGYGTQYTGLSHGAELKARMREVMLRRRWVDVAEDIPPITRSVVVADLDQRERNKLDILAGALMGEDGRTNTIGHLAAYRKQVASIKLRAVKQEVARIQARGEPLVVWTWHKDPADELAASVEGAFLITGDVPADERERRIEAWRQHPAGVLIATMAVAQVAVDFSHARIAIFAEIDYTPAMLAQAEMRTFAPTRGMDVLFVVANHFMDQRLVHALIRKLGAADPLGVGAAVDAINALRDAVFGPEEVGDLDRLLEDMLASIV